MVAVEIYMQEADKITRQTNQSVSLEVDCQEKSEVFLNDFIGDSLPMD